MPDQYATSLFITATSLSGAEGSSVTANVAYVAFTTDTESSQALARNGNASVSALFETTTSETTTTAALSKPAFARFNTVSSESNVSILRQLTLQDGIVLEAHSTLTAQLTTSNRNPTLNRLATQIYNLWGMEVKTASSISFARPRVVEIINTALQIVYSAGKAVDYFARTTDTITFAAEADSVTLPSTVQTLLGPVRFATGKQPLSPVDSINDFHSYAEIYGVNASGPRIYFLDRAHAPGRDNAGLTLRIAPTPTEETLLEIEYAREAPRYNEADLVADTLVPMPHTYVESLLLPIVKHIAASDSLFKKQELRPVLAADYRRARQMLGFVDPEPTPTARPKPKTMEVATA